MSPPGAVVIGHGSIGQRHARVLAGLGCRVAVVTRRACAEPHCYGDLATALAAEQPGYVVVATETADHHARVAELARARFSGLVLVEKPLFAAPAAIPDHPFAGLFVGYNLRFHPLLRRIRDLVAGQRVCAAELTVGQYLPAWRPGRDYRQTASAARGSGGALRDLSHELDYASWLFGPWRRLTAIGGRFGSLEIDSDDSFALLIEAERCPMLTITVNYLDRIGARRVIVNASELTLHGDLVAGVLGTSDGEERFAIDRDDTYRAMHRAVLAGGDPDLCDAATGAAVVDMIDAAERAAAGRWIDR